MALPANIQQFKSSGVYRLEFDKSQLINIPAETIRLVIGYSNKGPFNTPIFVPDANFFRNVFGDIDNGLELKGSYFHRSCLTALDRGPILALNLMRLEDDVTAEYRAMSSQSDLINKTEGSSPVKNFFNQDKFWFINEEAIINAINSGSGTSTLLNFANAGKKTFSVFTVKSPIGGFDVTAEEWYGSGKTPLFLDKSSWISDFLVRTIILDGDFSNYQALSIDPIYGAFFNDKGLKATITDQFGNSQSGLDALLNVPEVNVIAEYTGSLIPEFQDKDGTNLFIEDIINNETSKTGLVCAMNKDWFYDNPSTVVADPIIDGLQIDLVGHGLEKSSNAVIDFLSYYGPKNSIQPYQQLDFVGGTGATFENDLIFDGAGASPAYTLSATDDYNLSGATGGANIITFYGPNHPDVPATYTSMFATQAEFKTFADSVTAVGSYITVGITGASAATSPGSAFNASKVLESDFVQSATGVVKDELKVRVSDVSEDGTVGASATNAWFTLGAVAGAVNVSGTLTADVEVLPSINYTNNPGPTHAIMYGGPGSQLGIDTNTGIITTGDNIQGATTGAPLNPIRVESISTNNIGGLADVKISVLPDDLLLSHAIPNAKISAFTDSTYTTAAPILTAQDGFEDQFIPIPQNGATGATYVESVYIGTLVGDINEVFPISQAEVIGPNELHLTGVTSGNEYVGEILVGQFLVRGFDTTGNGAYDSDIDPRTGTSRLTRVLSARYDGATASPTYDKFIIKTLDAIWTYPDGTGLATAIERYSSIDDFVTNYTVTSLQGYTIPEYAKPNSAGPEGNIRMNEILDVMYNTNIAETLEDRDAITFRYIVDTFNHGIEPSSKARLSKIAKGRMNAFAILNSPSVKEFKKSTDPMFKYDANSTFDPRYIATGGNLTMNPNNIYSLPSIADGGNYCGFYTPNLRIIEKGATKFVPPAAHISNLFIDKYNLALPWSIVAGPRRGVVAGTGVAGVEYEFDRRALDEIEPFGLNAVINKRGFGLVINANQTAQQTVKSALSQVHVRELLIYIEDGIAEILKNYRWEFNTAQNRLEIKTLADNFLAQILNDGGLYDFSNVMDTTNNTTEVIDNNIGIIDTYVEPVRGMGILVNRVTILSTGSIQAGNF